jgi:hypothetical protein
MDAIHVELERQPLVELAPDEAVLPALEQTGGTAPEFVEANRSERKVAASDEV